MQVNQAVWTLASIRLSSDLISLVYKNASLWSLEVYVTVTDWEFDQTSQRLSSPLLGLKEDEKTRDELFLIAISRHPEWWDPIHCFLIGRIVALSGTYEFNRAANVTPIKTWLLCWIYKIWELKWTWCNIITPFSINSPLSNQTDVIHRKLCLDWWTWDIYGDLPGLENEQRHKLRGSTPHRALGYTINLAGTGSSRSSRWWDSWKENTAFGVRRMDWEVVGRNSSICLELDLSVILGLRSSFIYYHAGLGTHNSWKGVDA